MTYLCNKIAVMDFDGLISDINPPVQTRGAAIAKTAAKETYKRGSIMAKSSADGRLYILGEPAAGGDVLTPDCVLCDDTVTDVAQDLPVVVYTAGCFNPEKTSVKSGYDITEADKDKLRERGIVFKAAFPAN